MLDQWINPNEIHVHSVLNNRELDQNFIPSIAESMRDQGFLPAYPIDVFEVDNLDYDTKDDSLYICACGAHR